MLWFALTLIVVVHFEAALLSSMHFRYLFKNKQTVKCCFYVNYYLLLHTRLTNYISLLESLFNNQ